MKNINYFMAGSMFRMLFTALSAMAITTAFAQQQCPHEPGRYTPNGSEVIDRYTGLIWKRCSEGQTWSGNTCAGVATTHSHMQAMFITGQQIGSIAWRLPNVRELSSLIDLGCLSPAINGTIFPNTPRAYFWTTTPYQWSSSYAWAVDFDYSGSIEDPQRSSLRYVRLVRSSQ